VHSQQGSWQGFKVSDWSAAQRKRRVPEVPEEGIESPLPARDVACPVALGRAAGKAGARAAEHSKAHSPAHLQLHNTLSMSRL